MADTVINNPGSSPQQPPVVTGDSGGGSGVVVAVLVIVVVLFLIFFVFGRGWGGDSGETINNNAPTPSGNTGGTNINVPDKLEVDINKK